MQATYCITAVKDNKSYLGLPSLIWLVQNLDYKVAQKTYKTKTLLVEKGPTTAVSCLETGKYRACILVTVDFVNYGTWPMLFFCFWK